MALAFQSMKICAQLLLFLLIELFFINQTISCNGIVIKAFKIKSKDVFCISVLNGMLSVYIISLTEKY